MVCQLFILCGVITKLVTHLSVAEIRYLLKLKVKHIYHCYIAEVELNLVHAPLGRCIIKRQYGYILLHVLVNLNVVWQARNNHFQLPLIGYFDLS